MARRAPRPGVWRASLNAAACYRCHALDINFGLFEGAVISLFTFDSRMVFKYVDAVSNRFLDGVPSFVSDMCSDNLNDQDSTVEP